jgi:CheY-like chemotaxis protein
MTARSASPTQLTAPINGSRRLRILVVDDQTAICDTVVRILGGEHEVTAITVAKDALARITDGERFDVILSDLMMPEMTGVDLHAALLEAAPGQAQAMIFMTGGAFSEETTAFLRRQPNPSIAKPFRAAMLRQLLCDLSKPPGGDHSEGDSLGKKVVHGGVY